MKLDFCATWISEEFFELELIENEDVLRAWEAKRCARREGRNSSYLQYEQGDTDNLFGSLDLNEITEESTHSIEGKEELRDGERNGRVDRISSGGVVERRPVRRVWM
jgi:hypothetical protein